MTLNFHKYKSVFQLKQVENGTSLPMYWKYDTPFHSHMDVFQLWEGGAWGEHEELFMQLGHNCLYIWWWTIMKPSLLAYQCGERTSPHPDNFPGQFTPLGQFPTQTICSPSINTHNTYPPDNFPHQKNGTVMSGAEGLLEVEIVWGGNTVSQFRVTVT